MADKPTDSTPEAGKAPPPRRRAARSETAGNAPKAARAQPTKRAAKRAASTTVPKTVKAAAKSARTSATNAVAQAKPKLKAAAKEASDTAKGVGIGKILAVGAAASLSVAAGVAAVLGRKKIAKVTNDTVDAVMGKPETTPPPHAPTSSAD